MPRKTQIKQVFETIKKKADAYKNKYTTVRPIVKDKLNFLEAKFSSPSEYFDSRLKQATSEFYDFNKILASKELPINPRDIKLDPKDPLFKEKSRFAANQIGNRLVGRVNPRQVGNIFEIKLTLILRNKKLSVPEKKKQLLDLIKEIESFQSKAQVDRKIKNLENAVSLNVDKVTKINDVIKTFLEANKVNPIENKQLQDFLESWKRNLRNSDALLREYKNRLNDIRTLKLKIRTAINQL